MTKILHLSLVSLFLTLLACKPANESDVMAIVSADGRNATGLLPIRQKFVYGTTLSPEVASMVEDAMRLTYAAVECYGPDSAAVFALLEDVTRYSAIGLKREATQIYIPNRSVEEALSASPSPALVAAGSRYLKQADSQYKTLDPQVCRLVGEHTLSVGSFVMIMADPQIDFDSKQIIWLAARGRSNQNLSTFAGAFYKFLRENLGATPQGNPQRTADVLGKIDHQFNPCVNSSAGTAFVCDSNKNYRVTGNYQSVMQRFLQLVREHNTSYLQALQAGGPQGQSVSRGLTVAARVNDSLLKSDFVHQGTTQQGFAPAPHPSVVRKVHPSISVMLPHLPRIQEYFQIHIGTKPGTVLDPENPMPIQASRTSGVTPLGGFGLTGGDATPATASQPQPLLIENAMPATNLNVQNADPGNYWQRDASNPNTFIHKNDDGSVWKSQAVNNNGVWNYHNTLVDSAGNLQQQKLLFHGAEDLVGGAGKNTFVEYGIDNSQKVDLNNINRSQYANDPGRIFSMGADNKAQWFNFQQMQNFQGQALGQPLNISVNQVNGAPNTAMSGTIDIKPFQFTMPGQDNEIRLLGQQSNNSLVWLLPPKSEINNLSPMNPIPSTPPHISPQIQQAIATQKAETDVVGIRESKENFASTFMPDLNSTFTNVQKNALEAWNRLQDSATHLAHLQKNGAPPEAIKDAELKAAQDEIAVKRHEIESYSVTNPPALGQRTSPADQRFFAEQQQILAAQEEKVRLVQQNASELKKAEQQIVITSGELQAAKLARESFHSRNGNRYQTRGSWWWGGSKTVDTYNDTQRAQLAALHRQVTNLEQQLANHHQTVNRLKGSPTSSIPRSSGGSGLQGMQMLP